MKTKRILCLIAGALASCTLFASRTPASETEEHRDILIIPVPSTPEDAPRSLSYNPFSALLYDNYVYLASNTNCGDVNVVLYSTAGDYEQEVFDTSEFYIIIPISAQSGNYVIRIEMEDGHIFMGEFSI